jgi:hypothetical protein
MLKKFKTFNKILSLKIGELKKEHIILYIAQNYLINSIKLNILELDRKLNYYGFNKNSIIILSIILT